MKNGFNKCVSSNCQYIWKKETKRTFWYFLKTISWNLLRKWFAQFLLIRSKGKNHRNQHFASQKKLCIFHIFYQSKDSIAIGVNQALPSLYGGSLEITLKIPKTLISSLYLDVNLWPARDFWQWVQVKHSRCQGSLR